MCEIRHHLIRTAAELRAQFRALRGDTRGTRIEVTLPRHVTPDRDQRSGAKAIRLRTEQRGNHDIAPGAESAIHAHFHLVAQPVAHQYMLRLRQTKLPRCAGVLDARQRRRAGSTRMSRDQYVVSECLCNTGRDVADARGRHQLDADARPRVHRLQVQYELREIFDRIDVVMRRRRDQLHAGRRMPQTRDQFRHLVRRQLPAFARLRPLYDLDLDLVGAHEIFRGDAESRRGDLLDATVRTICGCASVVRRILAAFARVRTRAHAVHGDRDRFVRFR